MDGPSWNLAFPSTPSLYEEQEFNIDNSGNPCGNGFSTPLNAKCSFLQTSPLKIKGNECNDIKSPGSSLTQKGPDLKNGNTVTAENSPRSDVIGGSAASETKFLGKEHCPKVFLPKRNCVLSDDSELQRSVDAKIAKHRETYICMHDVFDFVAKKVPTQRQGIRWRHYDETHFLFALQDKVIRHRFVEGNKHVQIGDGLVKFSPWKKAEGKMIKPCLFKVWLRLKGLPIECFDFNCVEFIVCRFGRLYKCNLEKKNYFIGCFYAMIDCPNIDAIPPCVYVNTVDDGEFPVTIDKLYACPVDVYYMQNFPDTILYDDIISALIGRGKLIPLLGN